MRDRKDAIDATMCKRWGDGVVVLLWVHTVDPRANQKTKTERDSESVAKPVGAGEQIDGLSIEGHVTQGKERTKEQGSL